MKRCGSICLHAQLWFFMLNPKKQYLKVVWGKLWNPNLLYIPYMFFLEKVKLQCWGLEKYWNSDNSTPELFDIRKQCIWRPAGKWFKEGYAITQFRKITIQIILETSPVSLQSLAKLCLILLLMAFILKYTFFLNQKKYLCRVWTSFKSSLCCWRQRFFLPCLMNVLPNFGNDLHGRLLLFYYYCRCDT